MGRASRRKREGRSAPQLRVSFPLQGADEARAMFEQRKRAGDLVYERVCAGCGETTWGVIGGFGPALPRVERPKALEVLATYGTFYCSNCDPSAKQAWMMEVAERIGLS